MFCFVCCLFLAHVLATVQKVLEEVRGHDGLYVVELENLEEAVVSAAEIPRELLDAFRTSASHRRVSRKKVDHDYGSGGEYDDE